MYLGNRCVLYLPNLYVLYFPTTLPCIVNYSGTLVVYTVEAYQACLIFMYNDYYIRMYIRTYAYTPVWLYLYTSTHDFHYFICNVRS